MGGFVGRDDRILVTGSAGFIGRRLADRLTDLGFDVYGIDNLSTPGWKHGKCGSWPMNLRNGLPHLKEFSTVYHCAVHNITQCADDPALAGENIEMDDAVARDCKHAGVKLVYTSSTSVYGHSDDVIDKLAPKRPSSAYALTKLAGEKLALAAGATVLRLSNVYGPGQRPDNPGCGVVARYINSALKGKPLTVFNAEHVRDYTFIEDVLDMLVWAKDMYSGAWNVSTGIGTTTLDLAEAIASRAAENPEIIIQPYRARSFDTLQKRIVEPCAQLKGKTIPLWQGLDMTFDWFRNEYPAE